MSKHEFNYKVDNNLDNYINREIGRRMVNNGGIKVLKTDIIAEIAEHCEVGWENINRVKRGVVTPSLPVAMKIVDYFDVKIEDIFKIV